MRRILTVHYNEYALQRQALARGEKPPDPDHAPARPNSRPLCAHASTRQPGNNRVAAKTAPPDLRIIR